MCRSRQPHCRLTLPPRGTFANIRINLIPPETTVIGLHFCRREWGSIFIQIFVVGLERHIFSATDRVRIGRSRSYKVVDFGANRKAVCDLISINNNFSPILHRFWDMTTYWQEIANFSYPTLIQRPRSGWILLNFWMNFLSRKLESLGYSSVKISWS